MSIVSMADAKLAREAPVSLVEVMTAGQPLLVDMTWPIAVVLPSGTHLPRDVSLSDGTLLPAGPLSGDTLIPPQTTVPAGTTSPSSVTSPAPSGVSTNIVNQLTRWIPSESILLYVGLLALYEPLTPAAGESVGELNFTSRWIGFGAFIVATVVLVFVLTWGKANRDSKLIFKWPVFEATVAAIAFAAWSAALPDSPFLDWEWYNSSLGGYALLVVTVAISVAAWALRKSPDMEKVVTTS